MAWYGNPNNNGNRDVHMLTNIVSCNLWRAETTHGYHGSFWLLSVYNRTNQIKPSLFSLHAVNTFTLATETFKICYLKKWKSLYYVSTYFFFLLASHDSVWWEDFWILVEFMCWPNREILIHSPKTISHWKYKGKNCLSLVMQLQ